MTALGKAENFLTYENIFSYVRKFFFLRKKISPPSNVDFLPSAEHQIFVRTEKIFLPQENLFPCGRKNIFLRKEINFLAEGNLGVFRTEILRPAEGEKFPSARKEISAYAKIFFRICGNKFSYIRKFSSVYTAFFRPAQAGAERDPWKGNFPPRAGRKRRSSLARRWD